MRAADCALELGDEARFTDLLLRIADDYPAGDLTAEGLHKLAARRMLRGDFRGALVPLERATKLPAPEKPSYLAGRARYFRARSLAAIGDCARQDRCYDFLQSSTFVDLSAEVWRLALDATGYTFSVDGAVLSTIASNDLQNWGAGKVVITMGDFDGWIDEVVVKRAW